MCRQAPYLPKPGDSPGPGVPPEAALLDRQFRLLREDMVGPLRQELGALGLLGQAADGSGASGKQQRPQKAAAATRNVYRPVAVLGASLNPRPCVMVCVALPPSHKAARLKTKKEREEFWCVVVAALTVKVLPFRCSGHPPSR